MKTTKQKRRILSVIVIIIVVAVAFAYILPIAAMAGENGGTPAPNQDEQFGTDWGLDPNDLPPFPGEEEEKPIPTLQILEGGIVLQTGEERVISYEAKDFPDGTLFEWTSSNSDVARVDSDGRVVAVGEGRTEIEVKAEHETGLKRASVLVTVNLPSARSVAIEITGEGIAVTGTNEYELKVGDVVQLAAKIEPAGAKVNEIVWTLGNAEVATIQNAKGANNEFVADAAGKTQLSVKAGSLEASATINIVESGVPLDTIWSYIRYGVIIVVGVVAVILLLIYLSNKRKKERARQRAAAKRRREEAERRAREEVSSFETQGSSYAQEPRPAQSGERVTMKISGAGVGAGQSMPQDTRNRVERPLTLDDID